MTARWTRTFKSLLALNVVCAAGVLGCGFLSSRGDIWERFAIASAFGMGSSAITIYGLALTCYVALRFNLSHRVRRRLRLTDEQFIALSPSLKGVDPLMVNLIRQVFAKHYRSIGGKHFHPGDELEADLHLSDLAPSSEEMWIDLAEALGVEGDELDRALESVPIKTYGDLVLSFDLLWRESRAKGTENPIDHVRSHPVWDRALDG
jgi:hypothetical protein